MTSRSFSLKGLVLTSAFIGVVIGLGQLSSTTRAQSPEDSPASPDASPEAMAPTSSNSTGPIPKVGVREAKKLCVDEGKSGKDLVKCVSQRRK